MSDEATRRTAPAQESGRRVSLVLHCDFCGAAISKEDRNCRTCGAAVATAEKSLALAVSGVGAPLRQWGDEVDLTGASPQPALYSWEAAGPEESQVMPTNESTFGEAKPSGTRSYSRLRVYALAAVVAVIIVGVYMVVVGIDEQPSESGAAQDVPTAESESVPISEPEPPAVPELDSSAPAAEESTEPVAAATEQAPANSLTLTFDSPPTSPTLTEPAAD